MATLNRIFEALPIVSNLRRVEKQRPRARIIMNHDEAHHHIRSTRRLAIGITLLANAAGTAAAQDNGLWIDGPLPVPYAINKIENSKTKTRSFLKKGIYIAEIGTKGRMQRLRRYAFDLLAMADLIAQEDAWNYVRRYLRLKSTFMYFDFDRVISAAPLDDKPPLLDLANRLFDSFEKLLEAVRKQDVPQIYSCYHSTTPILQELMLRMA
ncbi:photosynthetic NDH subunit of lumenal location 3, chloroplastic-like [Salvia divinorum]|uniref:Photosynthetic NDH subunit of lumenal location 3, chloroplastic-like n=1 Tax=Salvia divinorum TaxID=28513 RepID=A0ABD1G1C1_SALDI